MNRPTLIGSLIAFAVFAGSPLLADTRTWPWKEKAPPDPALVTLTSVEDVTVMVGDAEPPTITISVAGTTPTPGFTELVLTPRIGDPKDLVFAFDAKGRPPQDMTAQVASPVTFSVEYSGAPIDKVGVVEVHGQSNCKAFSVTEKKAAECSSASMPQ